MGAKPSIVGLIERDERRPQPQRPLIKLVRQQPKPIPDRRLARHTVGIPRRRPTSSPRSAIIYAWPLTSASRRRLGPRVRHGGLRHHGQRLHRTDPDASDFRSYCSLFSSTHNTVSPLPVGAEKNDHHSCRFGAVVVPSVAGPVLDNGVACVHGLGDAAVELQRHLSG